MKNQNMHKTILTIGFLFILWNVYSQDTQEKKSFTYAEFKIGYGASIFGNGLKEKYDAGNFSTSGGGVYSLGAYKKFEKINYLNFGLKFKALGAAPSTNGKGAEMFFNYWGVALSTKYYPFNKETKKGLVLFADYFFVSQFTQKYRNVSASTYEHQFAIGNGFGGGVSYEFNLLKKGLRSCVSLEYEFDNRTGEVTNIGSKTFQSQSIAATVGVFF